jgi:hypothetical protein
MPYVVLKSCFAAGGRRQAGDVINIPADEARALTAMGRVEYQPPAPKEEVKDRAVGLDEGTPKPKTRGRKKKDAY